MVRIFNRPTTRTVLIPPIFRPAEISCSILLDGAYFRVNLYLSATFIYFNAIKEPIILGIIPYGK